MGGPGPRPWINSLHHGVKPSAVLLCLLLVDCFILVSDGEGWFDPWLLMCHFKTKVQLVQGEIHDVYMDNGRISEVKVTDLNGLKGCTEPGVFFLLFTIKRFVLVNI